MNIEDDDETFLKTSFDFSPEVQEAINQIIPPTENLEKLDLNIVDYINNAFPTEQSLSNIDGVILQVKKKIKVLDDEIGAVIRSQNNVAEEGSRSLEEAQATILKLFTQIREIKEKAEKSEIKVKEITRDIKQLDNAKKNLTSSITTLNHLHMLVGGVDSLEQLMSKREYGEISNLLEGITNVITQFQDYKSIPQIALLSDRVEKIKSELGEQIREDFEGVIKGNNNKINQSQLAEACFVLNVLEPKIKNNILDFFISHQLSEYKVLFADEQEMAWLNNIDHRFSWLRKSLLEFEERVGKIFPPSWDVPEKICVQFCLVTRDQLARLMGKRVRGLDVKLLIFALQRTINFENLCSKRFTGNTLKSDPTTTNTSAHVTPPTPPSLNPFDEPDPLEETPPSTNQETNQPPTFQGIISQCFEKYLSIYIDSQDSNLSSMISRFSDEFHGNWNKQKTCILSSCADLFVYYKKCLVQFFQFSTGAPVISLSKVFQKHLREYANKILINNLPKVTRQEGLGGSLVRFSKQEPTIQSAQNFIQSILKEGSDVVKLTEENQAKVGCLLCTAEYCMETCQQLQQKLQQKIYPQQLSNQINFRPEMDIFLGVINNCIQLLVQDLEGACEPALVSMTKIPWQSKDSVGDQSDYVTTLTAILKNNFSNLGSFLSLSRRYFTQFAIKFATLFIEKFVNSLFKCKPISTVGAEQLLLDTHSLKTVLQELPSSGLEDKKLAPKSYTRIVLKGMLRAEMILKVVMSPHENLESFVENYIKLLPESDLQELSRIVEMKGLKKQDQNLVLDIYKSKTPQSTANNLLATPSSDQSKHNSSSSPSFLTTNQNHTDHESSRIKRLEKLIKKKF